LKKKMVAEGGEKHIALEPLERDPDTLGASAPIFPGLHPKIFPQLSGDYRPVVDAISIGAIAPTP